MSHRVEFVGNSLPSSNELVLETVEETADVIVLRAFTKRLSCERYLNPMAYAVGEAGFWKD